ncbi:MAG: MBL fold metallo-hydrolase [Thermoprotei archaeon]|nr:MAG: MBL fold metallo-hydrolase [Thermoprotei archaeon]
MGSYIYEGVNIEYVSHACFRIDTGEVVIYIDPYKIERERNDGDIIVCTHEHFDHCSPEDIKKVMKESAHIVASVNCKDKVKGLSDNITLLAPGDTATVRGVELIAIPAYNIDKPYHTRDYKGIGVILTVKNVKIYHAGDTDFIPEMKELKDIDIALLPVSGKYVMNASEACEAAKVINPKVAIPMHYGVIVGSKSDAEKFKKCLEGLIKVVIL